MAGTLEGNRKIVANLKLKYGVDATGKSNFHKEQGAKGGRNKALRHFERLKLEDSDALKRISRRGADITNSLKQQ